MTVTPLLHDRRRPFPRHSFESPFLADDGIDVFRCCIDTNSSDAPVTTIDRCGGPSMPVKGVDDEPGRKESGVSRCWRLARVLSISLRCF